MKKMLVAIIVASVAAGGALPSVFAQETEKKNAVFVDLGYPILGLISGGFGIGLGYERALLPQLSVRGNVGYLGFDATDSNSNTLKYVGFDLVAGLRYYPLNSAISKLYLEGAFGVSPISMTYKGEKVNSSPVTIAVTAGWKAVFGGGLFLEPYVGYRRAIGEVKFPNNAPSISYDVNGLTYGFGLGWAF